MNYSDRILKLRERTAFLKAKKEGLEELLANHKDAFAVSKKAIDLYTECSQLLVDTSLHVQEAVTKRIQDLVTSLYRYVFETDDEFIIKLDTKRKTPVAQFLLKTKKNGIEVVLDPTEADGGGKLDVIALGLRLAALLLYRPALNKVLILDEPLRFISSSKTSERPYRYRAVEFLKKVATENNIQIIAVTHDSELVDLADAHFMFSLDEKGYTKVESV